MKDNSLIDIGNAYRKITTQPNTKSSDSENSLIGMGKPMGSGGDGKGMGEALAWQSHAYGDGKGMAPKPMGSGGGGKAHGAESDREVPSSISRHSPIHQSLKGQDCLN